MGEDACRTFQGSKSVIWYLLRCLNKIPEISITKTILMI